MSLNKFDTPLFRMFDWAHVLTPFAVERIRIKGTTIAVKLVYVFGIRVAYFNVS